MTAGARLSLAAACTPPGANACGSTRPPATPIKAAVRTMAGNGTANAKIAMNASAAINHSAGCLSVRDPMRHAACSTIATTAGLIP